MTSQPGLVVGVHDLRRRPGSRMSLQRSVDIGGLAISSSRVPDGVSTNVDIDLESMHDGVILSAHLKVPWEGSCRRCLGPAQGTIEVEIDEVFKDDPVEDILPIVDNSVELGVLVHDSVLLSLPLAPLCDETCAGPVPERFPVSSADDETPTRSDPRWAALDELRFDVGEEDG